MLVCEICETAVGKGSGLTERFRVMIGLRRGSVPSPMLFVIVRSALMVSAGVVDSGRFNIYSRW
jgi:hypothetical protein